jgi:hypothetical protein
MRGGDDGSGKGVIFDMRGGRIDSVDVVGSAVVASSEQDGGGAGGRLRRGIPCDMWNMVRPNASRATVP